MPNSENFNLEDVFNDDEWQFVVEGLFAVRAKKVEAYEVLKAQGIKAFGPGDFGIPAIDDLLRRFGEEPEGAVVAPHCNVEQPHG